MPPLTPALPPLGVGAQAIHLNYLDVKSGYYNAIATGKDIRQVNMVWVYTHL